MVEASDGKKKTDRISSAVWPFAPSYVIARAEEMENGEKKRLASADAPSLRCEYRSNANRLFAAVTACSAVVSDDPAGIVTGTSGAVVAGGVAGWAGGVLVQPVKAMQRSMRVVNRHPPIVLGSMTRIVGKGYYIWR
jgi:hypothetical protein